MMGGAGAHGYTGVSDETRKKRSDSQKGRKHTEESKKKISDSKTGLKHTEETKRKMSEAKVGSKNSFFNKTHTEETKIKMSKSQSKGVIYIYNIGKELEMISPSRGALSKQINCSSDTITRHMEKGTLFRGG
jgi:group I intron endonuclease